MIIYYVIMLLQLGHIIFIKSSKAAGPESLEDYFQKGALLGQKAVKNLWCVDTRPNSQKLLPSILSYLAYNFFLKIQLSK